MAWVIQFLVTSAIAAAIYLVVAALVAVPFALVALWW